MTHPVLLTLLLLAALGAPAEKPAREAGTPRERTFELSYAATVTGLKPGQKARAWLPVPSPGEAQDIEVLKMEAPAEVKVGTEKQYGNRVAFVEAAANKEGKVPLTMLYKVTRREVKGPTGMTKEESALLERFLQADRKVPIDGKPVKLLDGKELPDDPTKKARLLYDVVYNHMRYSKEGTGWGQGDAAWACDSKYGNCSDFHSLFISLARSQKIPAKFEIGLPLPSKRGEGEITGYHCWAFFKPEGKGWIPVDISEASKDPKMHDYYFGNLTEDRVAFSVGRDLTLVPRQAGGPVNFLIYPYVEVDGKEYPASKVEKRFTFRDLK